MASDHIINVIFLLIIFTSSANGLLRKFQFKAEYIYWSPDCVESVVIGINGQYPGPTIRATAGDIIQVELENAIGTEGIVIHWHGIRQIGTPFYDGAAYVSQCPINPGETFTYKFVVDRPGTYFYHGHFGLQRSAGFYGSLIVDPTPNETVPFKYDDELSIIVNDWWHRSIYNQETGLANAPLKFVGEPQLVVGCNYGFSGEVFVVCVFGVKDAVAVESLLMEGRGRYNCSLIPDATSLLPLSGDVVSCNISRPQCEMHEMSVVPGKTYRLRIASVASLSSINFILEGHTMTLVESDGHYVEPVEINDLDLYSGQSYSVLFTANKDPSRNYWAGINVRGRKPATPTGLAILRYNNKTSLPPTSPPQSPIWNNFTHSLEQQRKVVARLGYIEPLPRRANVKLMLLSTQNLINGHTRWSINNVSYVPKPTPLIAALKYNMTEAYEDLWTSPPRNFPKDYNLMQAPPNPNAVYGSGVYVFQLNDVVDVVLQNSNTMVENNSEIHPWHLHGHDFWVLGYGTGMYRAHRHAKTLNYKNPPLRNTVALFPYGWTYIRFKADNPGTWPFHCHVESHFHMGMGVMFAEGISKIPSIPSQALGCGLTKRFLRTP